MASPPPNPDALRKASFSAVSAAFASRGRACLVVIRDAADAPLDESAQIIFT